MTDESRNIPLQLERTQIFLNKDSDSIRRQFEHLKRRHLIKVVTLRVSAIAAAVITIVLVATFIRSKVNTTTAQPTFSVYRSMLPEGTLATIQNQSVSTPTLRLSTGSPVLLGAANPQMLASEAGFRIIMEDNAHLAYLKAYDAQTDQLPKKIYNTLSTPNDARSSMQILLPDGTLAYIGPGSTMKYPVTPSNTAHAARVIALSGEAWFDVAPNAQSPFIVETSNLEVSALGTAFRVNDYGRDGSRAPDSSSVAALTGKVKVSNGKDTATLTDNQEVVVRAKAGGTPGTLASMQLYQKAINPLKMPLKLDLFQFTHRNLAGIMREISGWYGMNEPIFKPGVDTTTPGRYGGGPMSKRLSLRKLLDLLQTDDLHFRIDPEQNHIIVYR